jgi:hypothetical protein
MSKRVVLVTGGRDYDDEGLVAEALEGIDCAMFIHGAARGADTLAYRVARAKKWPRIDMPAWWIEHKRGAGPIRNRQMSIVAEAFSRALNAPVLLVAFPGNEGTADMVKVCRAKGFEVVEALGGRKE